MTPAEVEIAVRSYRPAAVRWAASYVGEADAEDVAHAALETLLRRASDVEPRAVASWLRTTVLHLSRAHTRSRREALLPELPEAASEAPSPEDTLRSAQFGQRVRQAIASMPPSRRDVVVGVLAEGRTVAEVAREEGIPESTVRARLRDGTEDLRGVLTRERVAEKRRSGGFSSWAVVWAVVDWTAWARRKIVRVGVPVALGASIAGGALLALPAPRLAPTADELPVRAVETTTVRWPESTARAERGAPDASDASAAVGPTLPTLSRSRHDAGARFRAERFGR